MFDEKTEALAMNWAWRSGSAGGAAHPLRQQDGNGAHRQQVGVHSVPNALEKVDSYAHLMQIADRNGLGRDLVVQSAFGDSGHTTFFIASEDDFNKHKDEIVNDPGGQDHEAHQLSRRHAEACATQSGTLVGPLLTEVVGARELTPYKGGWCGNEVFPARSPKRSAPRRATWPSASATSCWPRAIAATST